MRALEKALALNPGDMATVALLGAARLTSVEERVGEVHTLPTGDADDRMSMKSTTIRPPKSLSRS